MPILLLASVVHVVRRNVFDFVLFFGTALVIIVESRVESRRSEASRVGAPTPAAPLSRSRRGWAAAAIALLSAIVALLPVAGGLVRVVLGASGVAALALAVARPAPQLPAGGPSRVRGWQLWATLGVAACLWELFSFIAQQVWPADQVDHPAVSDLVGPLLATWAGRAVFLLLWASAGWWLLRQLVSSGGAGTREVSEAPGPSATPVIATDDGAAGNSGADSRTCDAGGRTEAGR